MCSLYVEYADGKRTTEDNRLSPVQSLWSYVAAPACWSGARDVPGVQIPILALWQASYQTTRAGRRGPAAAFLERLRWFLYGGGTMNLPEGSRIIDTWRGKVLGLTSKSTAVPRDKLAELLAALEDSGCCAWRGRTACGEKPTTMVIGETTIFFHTFRSLAGAVPGGVIVFLCERHLNDLWADMLTPLRKDQERERRKYLRQRGRGQ